MFTSKTLDVSSAGVLKHLVHESWNIKQLESDYQQFLTIYQPIWLQLQQTSISQQQSFLLRTLLIHEYRRILLKDHELPQDMLPDSWAGFAVHDLVSQFYGALADSSTEYIANTLENADGLLPAQADTFWQRFSNTAQLIKTS
ncbi:MAG: phenylacetic acid degradation operon negative regulatory protein [Phenylobacterium sp.]